MQSVNVVNISEIQTIESDDFFDVLIIGGGPHALGVAARLREPRPAALYTDIEHSRLSFLQRPGYISLPRQPKRPFQLRPPPPTQTAAAAAASGDFFDEEVFPRVLALDASSPNWLGRWDGFFDHLDIPHLRSPMFFHPGPADVDGLEAFARKTGREEQCAESGGVENVLPTVGQSQRGGDKIRTRASKKKMSVGPRGSAQKSLLGSPINERERSSYARPTTEVFHDFCQEELVDRYKLSSVLRQEEVSNLTFGVLHIKTEGKGYGFTVVTKSGKRFGAKYVVMSIGGQECPAMPKCISDFFQIKDCPNATMSHQGPGWCHSRCFSYGGTQEFKRAVKLSSSTQEGVIVVIGGGLTSAQIADLAIRKGASKVILICRGYLKTKHYDFPLSWVTKYSNLEKMTFWQENCRMARLKLVRMARNGGSVNPSTLMLLKRRISEGKLSLRQHTTVEKATRDPKTSRWTIELNHIPPKVSESTEIEPERQIIENVLFIVAATGGKLDFSSVPFLSSLIKPSQENLKDSNESSNVLTTSKNRTISVPGIVEGLPFLTEDLQWGSHLPLFVMGAYAALELGPDAGNLSGSRSGAERVVSKLNELLNQDWFLNNSETLIENLKNDSTSDQSKEFFNRVKVPLEIEFKEVTMVESPQSIVPVSQPNRRKCGFKKMGARERRAGNIGGWFDGLEEVEA